MSLLHICNTFFERELESPSLKKSLCEWMRSHPIVLQLQFLPLLYADPDDRILVSDLPPQPDPRLSLLGGPDEPLGAIADWGPSLAIESWAKGRKLPYTTPSWDTVRTVNSKLFSFLESPRLPHAALIKNEKEAEDWIEKTPGPKVLKTLFGTAGTGHFHIGRSENLRSFLAAQFNQALPVIAEPWVERLFDFSTQWKDGHLLGATVFENEPNGTYKGTLAGPPEQIFGSYLWALEEHLAIARPLIKKIQTKGFFGHLGIDAYVYKSDKPRLQPIVEINGRKTMSWAAMQIQQKTPDLPLRFHYSKSNSGLLPQELTVQGKRIVFTRNIIFQQT